ncbi:MAG TPA: hypothetical protein VFB22_04060 [Candidatus Baltobacteraceae bacterium]|nr:hypothetical protein [Candidatus Baltobacteraceae bacterium]
MRVFPALLVALATGSSAAAATDVAATMDARAVTHGCAVRSGATIVAYDAREVIYRFVRSDGSVSPAGRIAFDGGGAVAQAVTDTWTPRGAAPWVALEIVAPDRLRTPHLAVTAPCAHGAVATTK